jgi:hypothetical protein
MPVTLVAWRLLHGASNDLTCRLERGSQVTKAQVSLSDDVTIGNYALAASGATVAASSVLVLTSPAPKSP